MWFRCVLRDIEDMGLPAGLNNAASCCSVPVCCVTYHRQLVGQGCYVTR
jgi:hypothetical protein